MDLIKDLFKGDKVIWIIFLFLCLISIVEVFSAASTLTYKSGDHWGPITQHSVILMVGVCIVVLVHNIPYKYFRVFPVFLLPLSTLLLIFVMGMGLITGDRVNGAARWMTFFGIQFQPSELAKMAVIIVTAFILSKFQEEDNANPKAFKYIMWITGIVFILIAPENGSTAALLFGVVFLMMVIGRVPWKQLAKLMGIAGVMVAFFVGIVMIMPTHKLNKVPMMHRVETWQNRIKGFFEDKEAVPAAKYDIDKDAQIAHANIAIASSNIIGKMPGNSVQRDFLSQAFSDFIFAIIIEELGLLEGRYWLGNRTIRQTLTGHFLGFYAGGGKYDLQWKEKGYQGEFYIASGISYGYAVPVASRLNLEFSIGIGLLRTDYKHYRAIDNYRTLLWQNSGNYTWFGPTKGKISLVWLLGRKQKGRMK